MAMLVYRRVRVNSPPLIDNISHLGKRKIIDSKCLGKGYVSSQEGIFLIGKGGFGTFDTG